MTPPWLAALLLIVWAGWPFLWTLYWRLRG